MINAKDRYKRLGGVIASDLDADVERWLLTAEPVEIDADDPNPLALVLDNLRRRRALGQQGSFVVLYDVAEELLVEVTNESVERARVAKGAGA